MASLEDLVENGSIVRIEIGLPARELPERLLFGTPDFVQWLEKRAAQREPSASAADLTPAEQIYGLFYRYVAGKPLIISRQFRALTQIKNSVWELKTPDIRIFGWFPAKDVFIAVFGDWADRVKEYDLYRGYRLEVGRIRRELVGEKELCIWGTNPDDVLSL